MYLNLVGLNISCIEKVKKPNENKFLAKSKNVLLTFSRKKNFHVCFEFFFFFFQNENEIIYTIWDSDNIVELFSVLSRDF